MVNTPKKTDSPVDENALSALLLAKNDNGVDIEVKMWFMTRNNWEYYVTDLPDENGYGDAYVQGFENEFGSFSMEELGSSITMLSKAHEMSMDQESSGFLEPPTGGRWATREEKIAYLKKLTIEQEEHECQ